MSYSESPTVSSFGIVWRPQSVNIEGGLQWDACLFVFCFTHTAEGQCACLHGTESGFFNFLPVNSHEGSTRLPICSLLDKELSPRTQKGLLLFLSHCGLNTLYRGAEGNSFVLSFFF